MFKVPTLQPQNHKQVNLICDERLPRIDYSELQDLDEIPKFTCFKWLT